MNDDDFLYQFQEPAPPEFVNALYQKITQERSPMTHISTKTLSAVPGQTRRLRKNYALTLAAAVIAAVILGSIGFALMRPQSPVFQNVPANLVPITHDNVDRLTEIRQFGRGNISSAAWSPDGKWLTIASSTGLWQYDASSLESPPNRIQDLHGAILTYSPDGSLLAFSQEDNSVVVLDTQTYQVRQSFPAENYPIRKLVFSPDSATIAVASSTGVWEENRAGAVRLWRMDTAEVSFEREFTGNRVVNVAFPPEDYLSIVTEEGVLRGAGGQAARFVRQVKYAPDADIYAAVLTPDGKQMIATGYRLFQFSEETVATERDGRLILYDIDTQNSRAEALLPYSNTFGFGEPHLALMSGTLVVAGTVEYNQLRIWEVATGEVLLQVDLSGYGNDLVFSPDAARIATIGSGIIRVLDTETGVAVASMSDFSPSIHQLHFSPAGDLLAAAGHDNNTRLWEVESGQMRASLNGEGGNQSSIAFNEDGTQLLTFANQIARSGSIGVPQIQVWDTVTGTLLDTLDVDQTTNLNLFSTTTILSSNGQFAASGYGNNTARVWDIEALLAGEEVQPVDIGTSIPTISVGLAFSPDNSLLAVAGTQEIWRQDSGITRRLLVGVWERQTGEEVKKRFELELPFEERVLLRSPELAFSPDNSTLLFSTEFGTYVWQLEGDAEPRRIEYSESVQNGDSLVEQSLYGFNFSPDGTILVTMAGGSVQFWDVAELVSGEASEPFYRWMPESSGAWQLAFSSDGKYLATNGGDGLIRLWGVIE